MRRGHNRKATTNHALAPAHDAGDGQGMQVGFGFVDKEHLSGERFGPCRI